MLETVVAKFITKYLCEYIETINKDQMEMKLWEGHATFENLILLPTALSYHNLPFRIKKGIIKRVQLNFPWKKLDSEAVIMEIEDVYILVQPDSDVLIKNDIEAQQSAIHISLSNENNKNKDKNENQEISKEFAIGTWQSLINTVIDNARILIKNIHIRIEYNYTKSKLNSEMPSSSPSFSSLNSATNNLDKKDESYDDFIFDDDEAKFVSGGIIIPELTLFTVDDDNKPLLKIVQASEKLRKQFKLNNLSVYFDTHDQKIANLEYFTKPVDINNFESEMKSIMNDQNHQFILNPFSIEGILLHTRNVPNMLKNILEITTHQLKFSMDYEQEQVFLYFNRQWAKFAKRRRYASCARPRGRINSLEKVYEFWQYFTRCAIQRSRPNEFNPKLALVILKNRLKYLKLIRKYDTQSNIMHPLLDSQLKTLDKKVGSSAALFCRAYSKAVVTKELNVINSGITAFDLSELKGLLKTTDKFFDIDSFSTKLNIPSFKVELLYQKNDPFLVAEFNEINLTINSVKGGADVHFSIDDFNVNSYVDGIERSIVSVEFDQENRNSFFKVDLIIPSTTDPFQMNVFLEPTVTMIDSIAIDRVITFFDEKENVEANQKLNLTSNQNDDKKDENIKINRIDAADLFQRLIYFKNHVLNVNIKKLKYIFPFEYERKQTSINFALKDFTINKSAVGLLANDAPEIKMDFRVNFTIDDLMIDDCCILKKFRFDFPFFFKFFTRIDQVCLDCNFVFGKINFKLGEKELKLIIAAINYGKMIKLTESQRKQLTNKSLDKKQIAEFLSKSPKNSDEQMENKQKTKTIISFGKITVNLSFNFEEIKFLIDNAHTSLSANSIILTYKIIKGETNGLCQIGKIQFIENEENLLKLPDDSIKIVAYQRDETEKLKIALIIDNLQIVMELRRYKRIYLRFMKIINYFIKEIDFESFLLKYNQAYQKLVSSDNPNGSINSAKNALSLLNSAYLLTKKNSKINLEIEKGKRNKSASKFSLSDSYSIDYASSLSLHFDENEEEERNENNKIDQPKDEDDGLFEVEFRVNNLEIIVPDRKGRYLITIGKLSITDHIEMFDFGCFRENRILIKPMKIVLHFDQLKNMKLGHLDSQFEPSDLWAILRLVDEIRLFFKKPNEEEEEEDNDENQPKEDANKKEGSHVTISFESSRFDLYHFNKHLLILKTEEVIIDVKLRKEEVFTSITINKAKANQFINIDENRAKLYEFVDFNDPITYVYRSKGESSAFQLTFPETTAYFTQYDYQFIFRWIPEDDDLNKSNAVKSQRSKHHYKINCASCKAVMMEGPEKVGTLVVNDLDINLTWFGNSQILFELRFSEINGYTNLLGDNFHFAHLPHGFYLKYHNDTLLITGEKVIVSFNLPFLLKVINTLVEILSNKQKDSHAVLNCNMRIEVNEILANFYPLEMNGPLTHISINNTKFALKAQQRLIATSIDNILLDVENANPDRAVSISNIRGILAINENISLSEKLNQMNLDVSNLDDIYGLEDFSEPTPFVIHKIEGIMNAKDISINYTHRFAAAVVLGCIPKDKKVLKIYAEEHQALKNEESIFEPLMQKQKSLMEKYDFQSIKFSPQRKHSKRRIEINLDELNAPNKKIEYLLNASVDSFRLILCLIDPLATIEFLDLTANINDGEWKATMNKFHLYEASNLSSNIIKLNKDTNLVSFQKTNDLYSVELDEMEICVDLSFYLNVANFILRSPFLHISDLQNHKDEIKSSSMASLPFKLNLIAPKLRISIPTSVTSKVCPLFHLDFNCKLNLVETTIDLDISDFSVFFSNPVKKTEYVPLFDKVTLKLLKKSSIVDDIISFYEDQEEENLSLSSKDETTSNNYVDDESDEENIYTTSITFFLSQVELKLSVIDLIIFKSMISDISKATDSIVFAEDNSKKNSEHEINSNSITSITFQTEEIKVILCKDNKSSKYVPLFNLAIPPISFSINNTEESGSTMKLSISPFVEYFNESTGLWDMIIEPFKLKLHGYFMNNSIKISIKTDSKLNVNFPLIAITQLKDLFYLSKSEILNSGEYTEFPNFWIENNIGKTLKFQFGNNPKLDGKFFDLSDQQQIPIYSIDQSTEIKINVDEQIYKIIPKLLTYPTFISKDLCVVRKPCHGGINIIFKSSTEILNSLDFDICIYTRKSDSADKSFSFLGTVKSKKRFPIQLPSTPNPANNKCLDFLFTKKDAPESPKYKHHIISLSKRYPTSLSCPVLLNSFVVVLDEKRAINVNMSVQNDAYTGTRLYTIYSPYAMISNLPIDLIKIKIDDFEYELPNNGVVKDFNIPPKSSSINIKVSIFGSKYGPNNKIKITSNNKSQYIQTELKNVFISVLFDSASIGSDDNKITTATFFSPCIIYNNTPEYLTVYEHDPKNNDFNSSLGIPISNFGLFTPKSFMKNSKMTKFIQLKVNTSHDPNVLIDIQTPRTSNAFISFNSATKDYSSSTSHLKYGFRYDVSVQKIISVVTFSPLVKVRNELNQEIILQAFHFKQKKLKGDPITIEPFSKDPCDKPIMKMTVSGIFSITVPSVSSKPHHVCLIKEQRICFRLVRSTHNENLSKFYLVELQVTDVGTYYEAVFREAAFPTPVLIENCLPIEIKSYQKDESNLFEIDPDSTSIFGFDDPLDCTSIHFLFKDGQKLHISTTKETQIVETCVTITLKDNALDSRPRRSIAKVVKKVPVFVEVKLLINGSMAVILTHKKPRRRKTLMRVSSSNLFSSSSSLLLSSAQVLPQNDVKDETESKSESDYESRIRLSSVDSSGLSMTTIPLTTTTLIELDIESVHISLIDFETREIALLTLEEIKASVEQKDNTIKFCSSIKAMQIDDQDMSATNPVCLIGHSKPYLTTCKENGIDVDRVIEKPFFQLECLIPSDVPFPSRISYLSAHFQRADVLLDSAFISDFIYLLLSILKPKKSNVGPQETKSKLIKSNHQKHKTLTININWLEMSPIYVNFGYNRKSGRRKQFNHFLSGMKYIPSLSPEQLILPGLIMERVIGEPNSIYEKVSSEYKTTTFNQIIQMLGSTGSILQTFGITNMIAEILGVKVESDLIQYPSEQNKVIQSTPMNSDFDNKREISGPFSKESLLQLSDVIKSNEFQKSHVISSLLMYKNPKIPTTKNEKHHNIDNYEMFINQSMTNGVFGVLKGDGLDRKKNTNSKETPQMKPSSRKRVPRAFLNNKIEEFEPKFAKAQETIAKGRVRMSGHLALSDNTFKNKKRLLVVLSDNFVHILAPDIKSVLIKINFESLNKLAVDGNLVKMAASEKIICARDKNFIHDPNDLNCVIECDSDEMASRMYVFIQSQRLMLLTYGTSLID